MSEAQTIHAPTILPPPAPGVRPEPGIYRDVPPEAYFGPDWPYVNASLLGEMLRSPQNARYAMANPSPETPAIKLGRAFHSLALEPALHDARYVTGGTCSGVIKSGDRTGDRCGTKASIRSGGEWFCKTHAKGRPADPDDGREVLDIDDVAKITPMATAIRDHRWGKKALGMDGVAEVSVVFDDPETGVRCKIRVDWLTLVEGLRFIVDLKTTEDGSAEAFARSVANYGYHRRAALYLRGLASLGVPVVGYILLTVEKPEPHVVRAYQIDDEALAIGHAEVTRLLQDYTRCAKEDAWDAGEADLMTIDLPGWAKPRGEPGFFD